MRPSNLRSPWRALACRYGGIIGLAKRLGTSRRSINRWNHTKVIPLPILRFLETISRCGYCNYVLKVEMEISAGLCAECQRAEAIADAEAEAEMREKEL